VSRELVRGVGAGLGRVPPLDELPRVLPVYPPEERLEPEELLPRVLPVDPLEERLEPEERELPDD